MCRKNPVTWSRDFLVGGRGERGEEANSREGANVRVSENGTPGAEQFCDIIFGHDHLCLKKIRLKEL